MNYQSLQLHLDQTETSAETPVRSPIQSSGNTVSSVAIISTKELTPEIENCWNHLHKFERGFNSPYYHPEFTRAVASVRDDVEIAVLKNPSGGLIGVLPYQRVGPNSADPIGGRMNDFHGILVPRETQIDIGEMMQKLKLKHFGFHALSPSSSVFDRYAFESLKSRHIDLTKDHDLYMDRVVKNSTTVRRLPQKVRALARDVGQLRFEFESQETHVLEQLIQLKRAKFRRTNTFDILSVRWASELLKAILARRQRNFRGLLSVLWAGDQLVAAHFGMISNDVLHYWFPVYDPKFAKYSPGLQMMVETCRAASRQGIKRIDMSYGDSSFKSKFCNGSTEVLFGKIDFNSFTHFLAKQRYIVRKKLKQIPFKGNAKSLLRNVFPDYGHWHFR